MAAPAELSSDELERLLLSGLAGSPDAQLRTADLASSLGVDHARLVGVIKSLQSAEVVLAAAVDHVAWRLTPEAEGYLDKGSPEAQVFAAVAEPAALEELKVPRSGLRRLNAPALTHARLPHPSPRRAGWAPASPTSASSRRWR